MSRILIALTLLFSNVHLRAEGIDAQNMRHGELEVANVMLSMSALLLSTPNTPQGRQMRDAYLQFVTRTSTVTAGSITNLGDSTTGQGKVAVSKVKYVLEGITLTEGDIATGHTKFTVTATYVHSWTNERFYEASTEVSKPR